MQFEEYEGDPDDPESIMEFAQNHGMRTAKSIGVLASKAWLAIEERRYSDASVLYNLIAKNTAQLSSQTFAMAQQVELNELEDTNDSA